MAGCRGVLSQGRQSHDNVCSDVSATGTEDSWQDMFILYGPDQSLKVAQTRARLLSSVGQGRMWVWRRG